MREWCAWSVDKERLVSEVFIDKRRIDSADVDKEGVLMDLVDKERNVSCLVLVGDWWIERMVVGGTSGLKKGW